MQGAQTIDLDADALPVAAPSQPLVRLPQRPGRKPARLPIAAAFGKAFADAVEGRRVFVLIPFGMIIGLIAYAQLPEEPLLWALAATGLGLAAILLLVRRSVVAPWVVLALACWAGFCLLLAHGAWFGTTMLARPAYGVYEMRVDEVV